MRLLVFGGTGMLGHRLWETCRTRLDAYFTVRSDGLRGAAAAVLDPDRAVPGARGGSPSIERALDETGAHVAVNCIGVVKQVAGADNLIETIQANAPGRARRRRGRGRCRPTGPARRGRAAPAARS